MVAAVGVNAPQAGTLVALNETAALVRVPQSGALTVYNVPTPYLRNTQAGALVSFRRDATTIQATQLGVLAVTRGKISNPRLRAWTFTIDGHDFYVLRLGEDTTLVYDLMTEQWVDWASFGQEFWRANIGMNWPGGIVFGQQYGSNVVVGDDAFGLLWILDPKQGFDDNPDYSINTPEYFERIVMGQVAMKGREVVPCYAAWLNTDMGKPAYLGAAVTLYTSDDAGVTYDNNGAVTVTLDNNTPELSWYSLGQIGAPGRLFKIVDDGAIARIDGLEMNDPDDR